MQITKTYINSTGLNMQKLSNLKSSHICWPKHLNMEENVVKAQSSKILGLKSLMIGKQIYHIYIT